MIRRTPIAVVGALLWAGVTACSEPKLPAIRYESDRIRVGTGFSEPLCAGDLAFLDAHVAFVESMTGARHDGPIDVYIYDDPDELPCRTSPFGCFNYDRDFAAALWQFVDHEIVHAVTRSVEFPSLFWNEGTAVALSADGTHRDRFDTLVADDLHANRDVEYATAGNFVRFVYENSELMEPDILEAAFEQPAAELAAQYEAEAPYAFPAWAPCPYPELPPVDMDAWQEEIEFSCDSEEATQFEWSGASVLRRLMLEAGTYDVRVDGGEGVLIIGCQTDELAAPPPDFANGDVRNEAEASQTALPKFFEAGITHEVSVTDGVYRLGITSGTIDETAMTLRIERR